MVKVEGRRMGRALQGDWYKRTNGVTIESREMPWVFA